MRVLVAEDEHKVAAAIREGLEAERYDVIVEPSGDGAFFRITTGAFDLILLDLTLEGRDGLHVLTAARECGCRTPVLVITARDTLADRIAGLDAGADDYLVKPFAFAELLARMRALLRRHQTRAFPRLSIADLTLDVASRTATRGGRPLDLSVQEFDLLAYLIRNAGDVVSRDAVARDVWREPSRDRPLDNVMDVHLARLRRKVDVGRAVSLIRVVPGVGFSLEDR